MTLDGIAYQRIRGTVGYQTEIALHRDRLLQRPHSKFRGICQNQGFIGISDHRGIYLCDVQRGLTDSLGINA